MSAPIQVLITAAGQAALVAAGGTNAITIAEVGITDTAFVMAPTLVAVPNELKRVTSVGGEAASANIVHMTMRDASSDAYAVRGFGLYLDDGTLFAAYSQSDAIFAKSALATFFFSADIAFIDAIAQTITFGDTTLSFPPASRSVKGVAALATPEEASGGTDDERIVTPAQLSYVLGAYVALTQKGAANGVASLGADGKLPTAQLPALAIGETSVVASQAAMLALAAQRGDVAIRTDESKTYILATDSPATLADWKQILVPAAPVQSVNGQTGNTVLGPADVGAPPIARSIAAAGLATGGGDLSANRTIIVPKAAGSDILAGTDDAKALTAKALRDASPRDYAAGWRQQEDGWLEQWGSFTITAAGGSTVTVSVTFPIAFPTECIDAYPAATRAGRPSGWNPISWLRTALSATGATFVFDTTDADMPFTQNVPCTFYAKGR